MTRTVFANGRVFTGSEILVNHAVVVEGQDVVDVISKSQAIASDDYVDLGGFTLVPGLIDLQVNGGGGVLFNDEPTAAAIDKISSAHRSFGTTGLLPTIISDTLATTQAAINAVHEAIVESSSAVLGIHLEGPHLNPLRKGVHNADFFRYMDDAAMRLACSLSRGKTLLTIAPERASPEIISQLVNAGVVVSAGHSDAPYDDVRRALDAGVTGFTHLFNAMSPLGSREPGVVGAALEDRHSWCGVIADGVHVHWASLRVALSAKPRGKIFLVTDAMPTVGTSAQEFDLFGQKITLDANRLSTENGQIAGSNLDMMTAVRNVIDYLDVPWDEAIRMASQYPAAFLGVENVYGKIAKGFKANMLLLDGDFKAVKSWVNGEE